MALEGLFLRHDLQRFGDAETPYLYTNFISSLDGRISHPDPDSGLRRVPPAIANPRDWRLFLELAVQADVVLTTARHLRAVAGERAAFLGGSETSLDLICWRRERGLADLPTVAAVSERLDVPAETLLGRYRWPLLLLTSELAPAEKAARLETEGARVVRAGPGPGLRGEAITGALAREGFSRIYSIGGPRLLQTLLSAGVVSRLYLTLATLVLGGLEYDTLTHGEALDPPVGFAPREIYLDTAAPPDGTQLLLVLDRFAPAGTL